MSNRLNKLYVDLSGGDESLPPEAALAGADGYILPAGGAPEGLDITGKEVLIEGRATSLDPKVRTRICNAGLAATAELREQHPECIWIPRVDIVREATAYHFPTTFYSESFRTYQPVFTGESPYRVGDGNMSLVAWLQKAEKLGFSAIWLHMPQAEKAGKGLDLDLRALVLKNWSGKLFLSGGATTIMHIKYLVQEGGIDALVVPPALACEIGCDQIRASLQWGLEAASHPQAPLELPRTG